MKKIGAIFIFIFLTGLFSGIFFSTNLSYENNDILSAFLLGSFNDNSIGFAKTLFLSLTTNLTLFIVMLPAMLTKYLCPLPAAVLWYKSFAIGFCSGLVYLNASSDAFIISIIKLFPQNLFFIPAFILISVAVFCSSLKIFPDIKNKRRQNNSVLFYLLAASVSLLLIGAVTESVFHLVAL